MSGQAKRSMMLCIGLEPAEQEKVQRLDVPISERFIRAGLVVRFCQGSGTDEHRALDFVGPTGTMGTIRAFDFLSAADDDAVAMITLTSLDE